MSSMKTLLRPTTSRIPKRNRLLIFMVYSIKNIRREAAQQTQKAVKLKHKYRYRNKISFDVPDWVPGIGGKTVGFNISQVSEIKLGRIRGFNTGGFPEDGLFMANHSELIGKFSNGKTAVVNNEQIIEGISRGVSDASSEQNELIREQNKLLTQILRRSGNGTIPVSTITKGLERQNRRNGKVIVPIGN